MNIDTIFLFYLMGEYMMDDREKELSEVRRIGYRRYKNKEDELECLKRQLKALL